ncbi:MAG: hypothetical protein AABX66_00695 [Nanoarchaeota archaeon]
MLSYNDLYEILRKEKYGEALQPLSKDFLEQISEFLNDQKAVEGADSGLFQDSVLRSKKQLENSVAIFKELILRRKKKILNLVFVATETGIMKRDYENMLPWEREVFDRMVKTFEEGDRELSRVMEGRKEETKENKMIVFHQEVEQFLDMSGKLVGPFVLGELANLESPVSEILVSGGKARFVDENGR